MRLNQSGSCSNPEASVFLRLPPCSIFFSPPARRTYPRAVLEQDYTVRLASFQGPLDLLLHLIRRAEVDITEISIAEIADQYLRHIAALDQIDVERAGEFLVTAATLLEMKSRLLAPPAEDEQGEGISAADLEPAAPGESAAASLVRALIQYKRFRDAAEALEARRREWARRGRVHSLAPPEGITPLEDDDADLADLSLFDLVQAFARISETVQFERLGEHAVVDDDTPIELHAADVLDRLRRYSAGPSPPPAPMTMRQVFAERSRSQVIGLFLAVLELVRQRAVRVFLRPEDSEVAIALFEDPDQRPASAGPDAPATP